jgi:hypothetical protein
MCANIICFSEHDYTTVGETGVTKKLKDSQEVISTLVNRNANLKNKTCYLRKKVRSLQETLDRCTGLMSAESYAKATEQDSSIPADLLQRYNVKNKNPDRNPKFPESIRKFALGLHLKSARAYRIVRKAFGNALPSEQTIRRWCMKVDANPGFNATSFR